MNNDLTNLLSNLPEGILIYDDASQHIVLANNEFKRLFLNKEDGQQGDMHSVLQEKIMRPYNLIG